MSKQFTLGKEERLKSRKQIDQLFTMGKKFTLGPFRITYLIQQEIPGILFGTGTSVRLFKRAVDRNRIKRLVREAYRLQKNSLHKKAIENKKLILVFMIYTGEDLPEFVNVYSTIGKILEKLDNLVFEKS